MQENYGNEQERPSSITTMADRRPIRVTITIDGSPKQIAALAKLMRKQREEADFFGEK